MRDQSCCGWSRRGRRTVATLARGQSEQEGERKPTSHFTRPGNRVALIVWAIREGRDAAAGIDAYLRTGTKCDNSHYEMS